MFKMDKSKMMKQFITAAGFLPERLWRAAFTLTQDERLRAEEFRIRAGRDMCVLLDGSCRVLTQGEPVTREEMDELLARATRSSVHTYERQLSEGFLPLPGGHRLGLCGEMTSGRAGIGTIRTPSSFNLRIAREISGAGEALCKLLPIDIFESTLIAAPPGAGKTTLLRDLVRVLSLERRVALIDERMEIAACRDGVPQLDVGLCDITTGTGKESAIVQLTRSMSPDVIAMDEITSEQDIMALTAASYTGCAFLASAHAASLAQLTLRPVYRMLLERGIFRNIVVIENWNGERRYTVWREVNEDEVDRSNADYTVLLCGRHYMRLGAEEAVGRAEELSCRV